MTFQAYLDQFEALLKSEKQLPPYDDADFFNYAKLNWSRMNRWLKHGVIQSDLLAAIKHIQQPQHWIVITEPWCGDAAHIVPFLSRIAELNPMITIDFQLRDSAPFLIENYLTNGGKSIPKLIIRDTAGNDLAVWGPRPKACQIVFDDLKAKQTNMNDLKTALQHWYNEDKGVALQAEILSILK
ncbi:MAG: thioredoxin family protein [Moraxellaceae bacterium]